MPVWGDHGHTGGKDGPQIPTAGIEDEAITAAKLSGFTTHFMVKSDGLDSNDGLSWKKAFKTIQKGLDAVGALEARGKGIVLVGPGGYTEDLQTPLDADGPFGMLLGVTPTRISRGAVYLAPATATRAILKVRARGWKIAGFEFDPGENGGCIDLDSDTADCDGAYAEIVRNLFCGQNHGLYGIDFMGNIPHGVIALNDFYGFKSNAGKGVHAAATNNGTAIINSAPGVDIPTHISILENTFWDSENHIWLKSSGLKEGVIRGNNFMRWGDNQYARRILELVLTDSDEWHNLIIEDNHGEGFKGDIICQQKVVDTPQDSAWLDVFKVVGGPIEVVSLGWEALTALAGWGKQQFKFTDVAATDTDLCSEFGTLVETGREGDIGVITGDFSDGLHAFSNGCLQDFGGSEEKATFMLQPGGTIKFSNQGAEATGTLRFFIRYRKKGQAGFVNIA